jgi:hypothetical protein
MKGKLFLHDQQWIFNKHGLGVRFYETETGVVVDADSRMVAAPEAISAGRLAQYAEAKWRVSVPISWLHRELGRLSEQGLLVPIPDSRLFTLKSK